MTFEEAIAKARRIRQKYSKFETQQYGSEWTTQEIILGFMGDFGDLAKLSIAAEGKRKLDGVEDVQAALEHELADCLWSIFVIADRYGLDIEAAFKETMEHLDNRLD